MRGRSGGPYRMMVRVERTTPFPRDAVFAWWTDFRTDDHQHPGSPATSTRTILRRTGNEIWLQDRATRPMRVTIEAHRSDPDPAHGSVVAAVHGAGPRLPSRGDAARPERVRHFHRPPLRPRIYIAIAIESRGGFHRARRGSHRRPGGPRRDAAGSHDARAHPRPDPRVVRGRQDHADRQRLRLRLSPDDLAVRARGHGGPRSRLPRRRELGGPARHGRPREAGRDDAGGDPAAGPCGPGLHVSPDDHVNIGYVG